MNWINQPEAGPGTPSGKGLIELIREQEATDHPREAPQCGSLKQQLISLIRTMYQQDRQREFWIPCSLEQWILHALQLDLDHACRQHPGLRAWLFVPRRRRQLVEITLGSKGSLFKVVKYLDALDRHFRMQDGNKTLTFTSFSEVVAHYHSTIKHAQKKLPPAGGS